MGSRQSCEFEKECSARADDLLIKDDTVLKVVLNETRESDILVFATWSDLGEVESSVTSGCKAASSGIRSCSLQDREIRGRIESEDAAF